MLPSTLRTLTPLERRLIITAFPLVMGLRIALWILPSRTLVRAVRSLGAARPVRRVAGVDVGSVAWAVDAASRRVVRATCLTQAIAAQLMLHQYGLASQLCLGVARGPDGQFRAHAWVEREGRIVIGGKGVRELTRLPDLAHARVANPSRRPA